MFRVSEPSILPASGQDLLGLGGRGPKYPARPLNGHATNFMIVHRIERKRPSPSFAKHLGPAVGAGPGCDY